MALEDRVYEMEKHSINLKPITSNGRILDIGGGGEGIIGQLMGNNVISIDISAEELMEAPEGPLKIIMAAEELRFLSNSFNTVTAFFALMYIKKEMHRKVLEEIYRVLKLDGELLIWDVTIPAFDGGSRDIFLIPLEVVLPEKVLSTSYGVKWLEKDQCIDYYIRLAEMVGFKVIAYEVNGGTYFVKLKKLTEI